MDDFNLFNEAFDEYKKNISPRRKDSISSISSVDEDNNCLHLNVINDKGIVLCTECGEEISKTVSHEKEWRYYGSVDNKNTSDPTRVQMRKTDDRNIYKDVENMGFSEKIITKANEIYLQVTKGNIKRGNSRKAIIFACIFQSFKLNGCPQTHEKLIQVFELNRKTGLQGLKHVALNAPKDSDIHITHITPVHLIRDIMSGFQATPSQIEEVVGIYEMVKNKDNKLNRARPQSVSSGTIYLWICLKKKPISLKEFAKKTSLSELTIGKMAKIIAEIYGMPDIVV
jgi:transcription initiation factor TFIIIB Brf1 subunit/transcription initiation factor TFIIB